MKVRVEKPHRSRIEMIPVIDMIFLVLVCFTYGMLSMAVHRGLHVALPTSSAAPIDRQDTITVTVDRDGRVSLGKAGVPLEDLGRRLREKAAGAREPGVLLFAHRDLPYQVLYGVLDQIRLAGIHRISLQAEARPGP
ncbi:MAG: biopolymer transporter ExbD [Deltaproteobacteria bacterium]|nr:biopolymer transporter ExbD [Deltaproteobacteria bacterium]